MGGEMEREREDVGIFVTRGGSDMGRERGSKL